jgi:hypothetical protein
MPHLRNGLYLGSSANWGGSPTGNESSEVGSGAQLIQARFDAVNFGAGQYVEKALLARFPKQCR